MVIYLDIIIFINFVINFLLLLLTKYLSRESTSYFRLLLGAIIATAFVPLILYFPEAHIQTFIGKTLYSIFIIGATFGVKRIQPLLKNIMTFYFISFSIGGGLFGIHYLLQSSTIKQFEHLFLYVNNIYGEQISLLVLFLGFPIILLFTKSRMDMHIKDKINYDQLFEVTIELNDRSYSTTGFIDSGNQLHDPLSNRPVVICDEIFLKKFFKDEDWNLLRNAMVKEELDSLPYEWKKRMLIVPYQGLDGTSNFIFTIRPDKLNVIYENQLLETSNVLIGIQLSQLTIDQRYHCLLHPEIIQLSSVKTA